MLMRSLLLVLLGSLATACTGSRPTERLDRHDQRQGRWTTYYDEARTQPSMRGRYRHGQPVGRWHYYALSGQVQRRERYRRHGFSDITYYYPGGQVARRGRARMVAEHSGPHFYWLGEWNYYSPAGALDSVQTYDLGKRQSTRYLTGNRVLPTD
jgi:antitoxin component YwqK of YwqJK toxin-antitoxin module